MLHKELVIIANCVYEKGVPLQRLSERWMGYPLTRTKGVVFDILKLPLISLQCGGSIQH